VTCLHPSHVPLLRDAARELGEVREADVLYAQRYVMDRGLRFAGGLAVDGEVVDDDRPYRVFRTDSATSVSAVEIPGSPPFRVLAFDLEMASRGFMPQPDSDPIIAAAIATEEGSDVLLEPKGRAPDKKQAHLDEAKLLRDFVERFIEYDPDVVVGYNQDNFDWPYLVQRARKLKVELPLGRDGSAPRLGRGAQAQVRISGRANVDLYLCARRDLPELKVRTLEKVAEHLGVMGEDARTNLEPDEITACWEDGSCDELVRYATDDVVSTLGIARVMLSQQYELARLTRLPIDTASRVGRGRLIEAYLAAEAYRIGELVPVHHEVGQTYTGALVFSPPSGVHHNVAALDFSAMYPTIMISHNISPDTLCGPDEDDCYVAPEVGHRFRKKPDGFIKHILEDLVRLRRDYREMAARAPVGSVERELLEIRQRGLKILTNSIYGYTGWPAARWYRQECAEATAAWGRQFILQAREIIERRGYDVLYGDTDSIFLSVKNPDNPREEVEELAAAISEKLPLEMAFDAFYRTIFFTGAKKQYAGLDSGGEIVVRGLEVRRGDWCAAAKRLQGDVLEGMLREMSPQDAADMVRERITALEDGRVDLDDITIFKTLTKSPDRYEARLPHVRAAVRAREAGFDASVGAKVGYVILKGAGPLHERAYPRVLCHEQDGNKVKTEDGERELDVDYYVEKQLLATAMRVLRHFGINESELRGTPVQGTLSDFMGG